MFGQKKIGNGRVRNTVQRLSNLYESQNGRVLLWDKKPSTILEKWKSRSPWLPESSIGWEFPECHPILLLNSPIKIFQFSNTHGSRNLRKCTYPSSEDSNQSVHPRSQISCPSEEVADDCLYRLWSGSLILLTSEWRNFYYWNATKMGRSLTKCKHIREVSKLKCWINGRMYRMIWVFLDCTFPTIYFLMLMPTSTPAFGKYHETHFFPHNVRCKAQFVHTDSVTILFNVIPFLIL